MVNGVNGLNQLMNYSNDLQGIVKGTSEPQIKFDDKGNSFSDYMSDALSKIEDKMTVMDQDTQNLIVGDESDLAQVMIHMTEAQLTLQTATQIRNKCLEAYNDVKNMQF